MLSLTFLFEPSSVMCVSCLEFITRNVRFYFSDNAGLLQFEVCPLTDSSFSVSFQHPVNESLVCGEYPLYLNLTYLMTLFFSAVNVFEAFPFKFYKLF